MKKPLIPQADVVAELKSGTNRLQKITKDFLDASGSTETPPYYAVEIYCELPILYSTYSQAVMNLAGKDSDLKKELENVVAPINKKVLEFAQGCLKGGSQAESVGPVYQEVMKRWGARQNTHFSETLDSLTKKLESKAPWLEPVDLNLKENDIIVANIKGENKDPQSWLKLARLRFQAGDLALSRLTYVDALNREPTSGALMNGLACVEQKAKTPGNVAGLFQRAADLGSGYALVNLALIHLKASHIDDAKEPLKKAVLLKIFDYDPSLKQEVGELTGP